MGGGWEDEAFNSHCFLHLLEAHAGCQCPRQALQGIPPITRTLTAPASRSASTSAGEATRAVTQASTQVFPFRPMMASGSSLSTACCGFHSLHFPSRSFAVRFSFENLPPHSPRKLSCLEQLPGSLEAVRAATPYWPTYQVTVFRRGMYDGWLVYPKCVREIACQVFSCRKTDHLLLTPSKPISASSLPSSLGDH